MMKSLLVPALASIALATAATGCVIDDGSSSLEVRNDSDYTIDELYLTDVGSSTWGRNLLGGDGLFPGESISLGADCGTYDAMLIDETGVTCEVHDLDLCANDSLWIIRNNTCTVFNAASKTSTAEPNASLATEAAQQ
jgi:hypothetical protein